MKGESRPVCDPEDKGPADVLRELVDVFASKGWLNKRLRIRHRDRGYRIFCSENQFVAHRINDTCAASWGFPCWAVCIVTRDQIIEDADVSVFLSSEPGVREWLLCFAESDFEII